MCMFYLTSDSKVFSGLMRYSVTIGRGYLKRMNNLQNLHGFECHSIQETF